MSRRLLIFLVLLSVAPVLAAASGQAARDTEVKGPGASGATTRSGNSSAVGASPSTSAGNLDSTANCDGGPCPYQPPQIVVTSPAPAASPWNWHERVAWGANLVLAVLGYVGILLALRFFKNIQRQTESSVTVAHAALEAANAALAQSQAIVDSERPWIVVTIEPFLTMENSFKIMATNRGRTPARIMAVVDRVRIAVDETQLPQTPEYVFTESSTAPDPMILLAGESAGVLAFSRDDVRAICKTDDELARIELWQESIFLFGRITYKDLITPGDGKVHETSWCCRYIHGEKNSAMVIAGPPLYNQHT